MIVAVMWQENTQRFTRDLRHFARIVDLRFDLVVKKVVFDLLKQIILRTPVDTGHLRNSWMAAEGFAPLGFGPKRKGSMPLRQRAPNVTGKTRLPVWIVNNLPYGPTVEFGKYPKNPKKGSWVKRGRKKGRFEIKSAGGYSKQAPAGMVRIALAVVEAEMLAIVREVTGLVR